MTSIRALSVAGLILTSLVVSAFKLAAQGAPSLTQGERVRVGIGARQTLIGTVDMLTGDTLYMQTADRIHHIPLATITTLEVTRGRHGHALMGALIGTGALGLVGLASGDDPPGFVAFTAGQKAAMGAVAGGAVGALIGAIIRTDKWEAVPRNGVRVAPVSLNRVGITVSLSF